MKFNGKVATWSYYPSINDTLIYAIVPEDATSGPITITTLGGTATSTQNFIVTVPPTITGLSATCGVAGNTVTITGTNFTGATDVKFNGTTATYTVVNGTTITATVPSGATTGAIVVTVPGGTATSGTFTLTYTVTQSAGKPGDTVIIAGSGFTGATAVKIGGITIPGNKTITATSITFTVPTGLVTGKQDVTVTLADATVVGVGTFYVVPNIIWDECWNVGYDVAGNLIVIVQLRLTDNNGEGVAGHDVRWRLDRINLSAVPNTLIYRDAPRYDNRGVNDYGEILMNGDFSPASDEYGYYWMYYRLGADGADVDVYVGADDFSIN